MQAKSKAEVWPGSPLVLYEARPHKVPVGNRGGVVEHLFTGAGVQAMLKVGVARRNLLAEQRPRLQEKESHRRARTRARDDGAVEWRQTEEALRAENRESRGEQCDLRVGPDRLDFAAKFEGVTAPSVGQVVRQLEALLVVTANAAHKSARRHQVRNAEGGLESRPFGNQVEVAVAVLHQRLRRQVVA